MTFIVAIGPEIEVVAQTDPQQHPDSYRCVLVDCKRRRP
jgi:hypothetical protein